MDSILDSLGVVVTSESAVEKQVVRDKIISNINYHGGNLRLVPSLKQDSVIPTLNEDSLFKLDKELEKELKEAIASGDDTRIVKAQMKNRFFKSMLEGDDEKIALSKLQYNRNPPTAKLISHDVASKIPALPHDLYRSNNVMSSAVSTVATIPRLKDGEESLVDGGILKDLRKEAAESRKKQRSSYQESNEPNAMDTVGSIDGGHSQRGGGRDDRSASAVPYQMSKVPDTTASNGSMSAKRKNGTYPRYPGDDDFDESPLPAASPAANREIIVIDDDDDDDDDDVVSENEDDANDDSIAFYHSCKALPDRWKNMYDTLAWGKAGKQWWPCYLVNPLHLKDALLENFKSAISKGGVGSKHVALWYDGEASESLYGFLSLSALQQYSEKQHHLKTQKLAKSDAAKMKQYIKLADRDLAVSDITKRWAFQQTAPSCDIGDSFSSYAAYTRPYSQSKPKSSSKKSKSWNGASASSEKQDSIYSDEEEFDDAEEEMEADLIAIEEDEKDNDDDEVEAEWRDSSRRSNTRPLKPSRTHTNLQPSKPCRKTGANGRIKEDAVTAHDDWEEEVYRARLARMGLLSTSSASTNSASADYTLVQTEYGGLIPMSTLSKMHDYQRQGSAWLWGLYDQGIGGILGDEMGLGKTIQLVTHFGSLAMRDVGTRPSTASSDRNQSASNNTIRYKPSPVFLVVCPATILHHWLREFHRWYPHMRACIIHSISSTGSELGSLDSRSVEFAIRKLQKSVLTQGLVVIITYEGLRRHHQSLGLIEWTAVCLDEGQKIRNPEAQLTRVCKSLPAFHRVILSGTPIQNNLLELWSLVDFCYPGRLGTMQAFQIEFATPIRIGGYSNVSQLQAEIAVRIATSLQRIVMPMLLRRRKDDVAIATKLPGKTEQVLFCPLSSRQRQIYREILRSPEVDAVLNKRAAAFRSINTLRQLCNHPALVFQRGRVVWHVETESGKAAAKKSRRSKDQVLHDDNDEDENDDEEEEIDEAFDQNDDGVDIDLIDGLDWSDSGKLLVLSKVLPLWYSEGHKVLLFSQTRSMLNLVETMLKQSHYRYLRLDGSTPVVRREGIISTFNEDESIFCMILTTRTGGVGISLTSANRVVLIDPDWNPQTDVQARERAWRLGQTRDVTIFRLITRGSIEEKIYQRQIFKLLLSNRILDNPNQKALFSKNDISELFELRDDVDELPQGGHVDLDRTDAPHRMSDGAVPLITAPYVEQSIPDSALHPREALPIPNQSGAACGNKMTLTQTLSQASEQRDRRLLKALFAGEALAGVYDHGYLEPGKQPISSYNAERAATAAQNAERNLRASTFTVSSSHSTTGRGRGGRGGRGGASSQAMLGGLRAATAIAPASTGNVFGHQQGTGVGKNDAIPLAQQLERRLGGLFSPLGAPRGKYGQKDNSLAATSTTGLSIEYIISHFRDIGDHLAPLFKDALKKMCEKRADGRWYLKD